MCCEKGHWGLARRWDHRIIVTERPDGRAGYRDAVTIEAGLLTPLVMLCARLFHAHRQGRWHRLVSRGALAP